MSACLFECSLPEKIANAVQEKSMVNLQILTFERYLKGILETIEKLNSLGRTNTKDYVKKSHRC